MEKQKENRSPPAVEDLYNAANRNYEWEAFKYSVPKHYHHPRSDQPLIHSKTEQKLNYLDTLLRTKRIIPAPNAYSTQQPHRPLSGKMDKRPRTTLTDSIIAQSKHHRFPGPGAYFTRPKTADSKLNRNAPQYRQHYLNEVEYLSSQSPGVGEYNIRKQGHIATPKYCMEKRKQPLGKDKVEKEDKPQKEQLHRQKSAVLVDTFEWLSLQKKSACKNFFGKSKRFRDESRLEKRPGPTSYKLNTKWTDTGHILKASASAYNMNLRSVYYS